MQAGYRVWVRTERQRQRDRETGASVCFSAAVLHVLFTHPFSAALWAFIYRRNEQRTAEQLIFT
jgi:hypothetical protein